MAALALQPARSRTPVLSLRRFWVRLASRTSAIFATSGETELRNAIEAAAGREVVRPGSADGAVSHFEHDIRVGRLIPREHDWEHVWRRAMELSKEYTREILCRTLDIVHVALAEKEEAGTMVTGDRRQAELCQRIGLEVTFIDATKY